MKKASSYSLQFKAVFFTLLGAVFFVESCQTGPYRMPKEIKKQVVENVDIPRFMGDWYVIAHIPTIFETKAYNALETYEWNDSEDRIDVTFAYKKASFDGTKKVMTQKAWIKDSDSKAHWKVQPFWPLKFDYLVIDLGDNYQWTTIGVPDKSYVWIMAREPEMKRENYAKAVGRIEALGYDLTKLRKVPQNGSKP